MNNLKALITNQESNFKSLAKSHGAVNFAKECEFALQCLQRNSYLAKVAEKDQLGLESAIKQIASIGISLNPVKKHAYLVPRSNGVVLDISYIGLIHLAAESGSIEWVKAELVYEKDTFEYLGVNLLPRHEFDPFKEERGKIRGTYCVAKTYKGDYLVEVMSIGEVYKIRDRTDIWKSYKSGKAKDCPWASFEEEMIKKTVIKRASKTWPKVDRRLSEAVHQQNENDDKGVIEVFTPISTAKVEVIKKLVASIGRELLDFINYFSNHIDRHVDNVEDLSEKEGDIAISQLNAMANREGEKHDTKQ